MFNDSLSMNQCEKLLKQLSETAFPFQCAHGRYADIQICPPKSQLTHPYSHYPSPSLVPLIEISAAQSGTHRSRIDWVGLDTMADG